MSISPVRIFLNSKLSDFGPQYKDFPLTGQTTKIGSQSINVRNLYPPDEYATLSL